MRRRPSSRLLVLSGAGRVLLFRFSFKEGVLAGQTFWATPGGAVEAGESFETAAVRELREETGIELAQVGPSVAAREFILTLADGSEVIADERYFWVGVPDEALSRSGWTALEKEVMIAHRWWSRAELAATKETVFPENLLALLDASGPDGRRPAAD